MDKVELHKPGGKIPEIRQPVPPRKYVKANVYLRPILEKRAIVIYTI